MLHFHKRNIRIGLDIDEVCAAFLQGYSDKFGASYLQAKHFYFSYQTMDNIDTLGEDFWMGLPPLVDGTKLPFIPTCYVSHRLFDSKITERWLEKNNFPCSPVYHVAKRDKIGVCKDNKIDVFVDDFLLNFQELNAASVPTLLMDQCHNRQFDVGHWRLNSLLDLPKKIIELDL